MYTDKDACEVQDKPPQPPTLHERRLLLAKVYTILVCQLGFTLVCCLLTLLWPALAAAISHPAVLLVSFTASCISLFAMHAWGRTWPCNLVMLVLFTTSVGVETSHIVLHVGNPPLLLSSLGVTLAIFATLSFTALTAREDFSFLGTWLLTSLVGFVLLTLAQLVLHSEWMHMAIAWVGTALFSGYVVYDTSNLVHLYGPEEGVDAAIALYLDALNLFLSVVQVLEGSRD